MDTRRLLSATILYGLADVVVLAVGGFLLLPLYTRTLSQEEFGTYVIVRANSDIFTYLLHLGLPSAVARIYFDYRERDRAGDFLGSILTFFVLYFVAFALSTLAWGPVAWRALSPTVPVMPFLAFCVAMGGVGFFATLGALWLRLEGRVKVFASLQLAASALLAATAFLNLVVLKTGLNGLLIALMASAALPAVVLPWALKGNFRPRVHWDQIVSTFGYAGPVLLGYVAYFVLNRFATLVLQHHADIREIAVFGVAQQLALIVTVAATAFGKASQPALFSAPSDRIGELLSRSGRLLSLLMFSLVTVLLLFASDIFSLVAPRAYGSGHAMLLILVLGGFAYSFTLTSDSALLYHRRPKTSVGVSMLGATIGAGLAFALIPTWGTTGASLSAAGGFLATSLLSQWMAHRVAGYSSFRSMATLTVAAALVAALAAAIQAASLAAVESLVTRALIAALILGAVYLYHRKPVPPTPCKA